MEKLRRLMMERLKHATAGLPGVLAYEEGPNPRAACLRVLCRTEAEGKAAEDAMRPLVGSGGYTDWFGDDGRDVIGVAGLI